MNRRSRSVALSATVLSVLGTASLPAVAGASPHFGTRTLAIGDRGYDVKLLEWKLANRSLRPGPVDGTFDGRTRGAVMRFARTRGLGRRTSASRAVVRRLQRERGRFDRREPLPARYNLVPTATLTGTASYYGPGFDGARTASGETFRRSAFTAAHKSLPFGTVLRVTRHDRSVIVRVNDRGPFVGGRFLDLSEAARNALGMPPTAYVHATVLTRERIPVR